MSKSCMRYAGEEVEVSLKVKGEWAEIWVEDDGPGIASKLLPHIFDRFYKGENGKFGLGLSIVKAGMEYMGGTAGVENKSTPLHGAVYRLGLPVHHGEALNLEDMTAAAE